MFVGKSKILVIVVSAAFSMLFSHSVTAAEDPANFENLDGVVVQCIISTKAKYARTVCDELADGAQTYAERADVRMVYLGAGSRKTGKEGMAGVGFKHPLHLLIYVRGTRGRNVGTSVHMSAGIEFLAAVEKGAAGDQPSRKGFLVMWESAAVGQGPARKMTASISRHMKKKMKGLFDLLAKAETRTKVQ